MGSVYLVLDTLLGDHPVALKVLRQAGADPGAIELFREEFRSTSRLRHPNLAEVYDFGVIEGDGRLFLTMEYVEGRNLSGLSRDEALARFDELAVQSLRALDYIHSRGLLHNDIKPQNIMLRDPFEVKLLDFGLAHGDSGPAQPGLSGTVHYIAPERFRQEPVDVRSDLYSLGVVLYEVLTGRHPFDGEDTGRVIQAILEARLTPPRVVDPDVPARIETFLLALLSRAPAGRPATASAALELLGRGLPEPLRLDTPETCASFVTSGRYVGRDAELEELLRLATAHAAAPADDALPRLVLVGGPSGIGKSRLLRELRHRLQLAGLRNLTGRCYEDAGRPLAPIVEILRQLPAEAAIPEAQRGTLRQLLHPGEPDPPAGTAVTPGRREFIVAVADILDRMGAGQPGILFLEDLHWSDAPGAELLEYLAARPARGPWLLIGSLREEQARTSPIAPLLRRAPVSPRIRLMPLAPLTAAQVADLLDSMLPFAERPEGLAAILADRTEGNPLYLEEMMKSLADEGTLRRRGGAWIAESRTLDTLRLPASLLGALAQRIALLPDDERRVAEVLAAFNRPVPPALLAAAAGLAETRAAEIVGALERLRLAALEPQRSGPPLASLAHSRIRQAIYEGLPEGRRRELHAAAGLAIEAAHAPAAADVLDELAHHFAAAGDAPRAADYSWRAGVRAIDLFDYGRAVGHLTKVLEFLPPEATARRLEALGRLTFIHAWPVGDPEKCLANARRMQEEARRAGSELHEAKALSFQGWAQSSLGQEEAALESGRRGLALVRRAGGPADVCSGLNLLGLIYARRGDNRQAKVHFEEGLALGESMDDRPLMTVILGNLVLNAIGLGEGEAAIPMVKRLLAFCSELGLEYDYNRFLVSHGIIQEELGNLEAAIEASRQAAAWARERANAAILIGALNNLGLYSASQGVMDRALRHFQEEKTLREEGGDVTGLLACIDPLGRVLLDLGRVERAAAMHREGVEKARAAGTRMQEGFLLAALAADRLASGAWDDAALHARDALQIGRELDHARITCYALCAQALLAARRGDRKEAAAAVRLLTRVETKRVRFTDRLRMNLTLGRVAVLAGKPDEALREARAGIAATERNGYREFHWRFRALAGDAWSAKGLDEDALASYNAARSVIRDIASGIEDKDVRDDYLNEDGRRDLLRRERGPQALPLVAEAPAATDDAVRLLSSIYEITQVINSILDLKELLNKVMDLAIDSVRAERGLVFLYRSETDEMEMVVARNMEHQTIRDATEYSRSILREAGRGQSILSVDAVTDDRFRQYRSVVAYKIRSLLCVPLRMRDRIIGTVYVDTRRPGMVFAEQDRRFLEAFANQAAIAIENARLYDQVRQENRQLKAAVQERYGFENIIGRSARMREVFALLSRISGSGMRVMIRGESGTGKELIARAIHHNSPRRDRRFFSENCAALTDSLLESELFGHVKGAFTGADSSRKGLFEMADGGTLFLDEIGDTSLAMQSKLLRVLEHGEIRPVGAETSRHVDVRVISATNRDLEAMIRKKQFREDLYYRMNGVTVNLPALRERRDDIPLIIDHFLTRMARENNTPKLRVDPALMALLTRYDWPGNVRELENQVSKLALFAAGDTLTRDSAGHDPAFFQKISASGRGVEFTVTADDLRRALQEAGGNRDRAAALLGISRATLFRKLKEHRVSDRPQPSGRPPQV